MKKLFATFALVMGLGATGAFAENMIVNNVTIVNDVNDFTPIELKDIPKAVQDTLAKSYKDFTIKSAAVEVTESGVSTYQITLTDADGTDTVVYFNDKGDVIE